MFYLAPLKKIISLPISIETCSQVCHGNSDTASEATLKACHGNLGNPEDGGKPPGFVDRPKFLYLQKILTFLHMPLVQHVIILVLLTLLAMSTLITWQQRSGMPQTTHLYVYNRFSLPSHSCDDSTYTSREVMQ
jgi:hypothetical protein